MDLMMLIEKIPANFWGIIVGSFFTIIGVVLTNRSNTRRLQIQLEQDRNLKFREQDLALRKEVYLAAAEAISAGLAVVGRVGDLDIPYDKLMQSYSDKAPSIAKVNIVAGAATIKALSLFTTELAVVLLKLSLKRIKLTTLQQRLAFVQEHIGLASKERDRIASVMKELNFSGPTDQRQWAMLQESFECEGKKAADLAKEQQEIQWELFPQQVIMLQESLAHAAILNRLLVPVLASVREELGLPFDENSYAQVIEQSQTKVAESFKDFVQEGIDFAKQQIK